MEKIPKFIKDFSKEKFKDERDRTAKEIKSFRSSNLKEKEKKDLENKKLEGSIEKKQLLLEEELKRINGLRDKIEELSSHGVKKIFNHFKLKSKIAELILNQRNYDKAKLETNKEANNKEKAEKDLDLNKYNRIKESDNILNNFYESQKQKWLNSEYSKEEIKKYFSEEHLASLTLEEYVFLLRRFPSETISHVTRQGIRDHVGHMYHISGEDEYSDGFMKILKDGRLRSVLGIHLNNQEKEKSIVDFILNRVPEEDRNDKEKVISYIEQFSDIEKEQWASYLDAISIHFAAEEVADCYYGSERDNEIFIIFPSLYISSQYYFSGNLTEKGGGYHNDQWVYANEEKGINLNSGIIFISKETMVDKKSGSRYELDENNNPIENIEYIDKIKEFIKSEQFDYFAEEVKKITGKMSFNLIKTRQIIEDDKESESNRQSAEKNIEKIEPYLKILEKFEIKEPRLQSAIIQYHNLESLVGLKNEEINPYTKPDDVIKGVLKSQGILFKESKQTITSQEFWEKYFLKNPNQKPSKIVYYEAGDPTEALDKWKKDNFLFKKSKDKDKIFPENRFFDNKEVFEEIKQNSSRFKILATEIINKHFENN